MTSPIYIEIPEYRSLLDEVDDFKEKFVKAKKLLRELHKLRSEENEQMYYATEHLNQIDQKLKVLSEDFVDQ